MVDTQAAPPTTLGERIRVARRERGLSQSQLAGSELTKGFISQVESGLVRPSLRSLQILASRLGKGLDYFLGDEVLTAGKRATFHLLAAQAAAERADWVEVRASAEQVRAGAPSATERARALRLLAGAEIAEGQVEEAFERIREALAVLPEDAEAAERAELLYLRATIYSRLGQIAAAGESLEAARDVVDRNEVVDPRLRAQIQVALGTMLRRLNRTASAMAAYQSALALASRSSEHELAARSYMGVAVSLYDSGDLDRAIGSYRRALEMFERIADTSFELRVGHSLAAVQLESGDVAGAEGLATRVRDRALAVGEERAAAVAEVILARVALASDRAEDALRSAEAAERALSVAGEEVQRADALRVIAAANDRLGRTEATERCYRAALELLEQAGDQADLGGVAAEFARWLRARGRIEEAFEMLERAHGASAKRPGR